MGTSGRLRGRHIVNSRSEPGSITAKAVAGAIVMALLWGFSGCTSSKASGTGGPAVSGKWLIQQVNCSGAEFTGVLDLKQDGLTFSGTIRWTKYAKGKIISGTIGGVASGAGSRVMSFIVQSDDRPDDNHFGRYYATFGSRPDSLYDGTTIGLPGGMSFGTWSAIRIGDNDSQSSD
jgi:hypothetical protein